MRNRGLSTADSDLSASTQRLAYRFRNVVAGLPVLLAVFVRWHECENDILVWTAAGMTFGLGWFIRIWAQQHLGFLLRKQTTLTRTGPYALVRNPIYIGNTLICIGLVVTSELLWLVPIALVVCAAAYSLTVHHEERYLAQRYGQPYLEYTRDVPRWIPRRQIESRMELITHRLLPSIRAEAHNLALLIPFMVKELTHIQ